MFIARPSLPMAASLAHAEIVFQIERAVGASPVLDRMLLLGAVCFIVALSTVVGSWRARSTVTDLTTTFRQARFNDLAERWFPLRLPTILMFLPLVWLLATLVMLILCIFNRVIIDGAALLKLNHLSLVVLVAFLFLFLLSMSYSLSLSRLSENNKTLNQQCALLAQRVEELEQRLKGDGPVTGGE